MKPSRLSGLGIGVPRGSSSGLPSNSTADLFTSVSPHILESFIPGFGIVNSLLLSLGIDVTTLVSTFFIAAAVFGAFKYAGRSVYQTILSQLTCTVSIYSNDKLYEQVMHWISLQEVARSTRYLRAKTKRSSQESQEVDRLYHQRFRKSGNGQYYFADIESTIEPEYTPEHGHHRFWYKGQLILFHRERESINVITRSRSDDNREKIHLKCFGWNPKPIKQLLMECKRRSARSNRSTTTIRRSGDGPSSGWQSSTSRPSRSLDTVYMDESAKSMLLADLREYLDPDAQKFYARRGIPYRRGYLFYGPPGTGKTSLSFALAGTFGFELYTVSLREPFMSEHKLTSLFASLPQRCIVLLEDVDTAGLEKRANVGENRNPAAATGNQLQTQNGVRQNGSQTAQAPAAAAEGLTLSGLLNAIDGVASQEGRILIMTSNDPESLDKALVRPGRVDMQIYFANASKEHIREIFRSMYAQERKQSVRKAAPSDESTNLSNSSESDGQKAETDIEELANQFTEIIPSGTFTTAEIQGYLLLRRKNPQAAVSGAAAWRDALLVAHEAGRNTIDVEGALKEWSEKCSEAELVEHEQCEDNDQQKESEEETKAGTEAASTEHAPTDRAHQDTAPAK